MISFKCFYLYGLKNDDYIRLILKHNIFKKIVYYSQHIIKQNSATDLSWTENFGWELRFQLSPFCVRPFDCSAGINYIAGVCNLWSGTPSIWLSKCPIFIFRFELFKAFRHWNASYKSYKLAVNKKIFLFHFQKF